MIPEQFQNHSGINPFSFQTSRARADQGAGSREGNREGKNFRYRSSSIVKAYTRASREANELRCWPKSWVR